MRPIRITFHLLLISFLFHLHHSTAFPHHRFNPSQPISQLNSRHIPPTTYFEVTKPIHIPDTKPYSHLILHHNFAFTYGKPPVTAPYTAPPNFQSSKKFSTIILEWSATCEGRQFDRIFGIWLGGVELLRSCTAEPRSTGIFWKVEKDITSYYSLLMKNNTLAVYLGNVVDSTYTGVYHVNITIHFYPPPPPSSRIKDSKASYSNFADLILPISRTAPLNDGLWFEIQNSTDIQVKEFNVPPNAYRAVLEVYVSFHENDEFWYTNLPNEYISANNLSIPGNGPFREVLIHLDDEVIGAIWPFTVIFTGGINPLLWRPITAIGSFNLPTYNIQVTPSLPKLLDGKTHKLGFTVTNGLNVWYIDANLHIWLDNKMKVTYGKIIDTKHEPSRLSSTSHFQGLDGTFITSATRSVSSTGWLVSSHGNITTTFNQNLMFLNNMVIANNANLQTVNQEIEFNTSVSYSTPLPYAHHRTRDSYKKFLLYLATNEIDQGDNGSYALLTNVTLGYNEDKVYSPDQLLSSYVLRNLENAGGEMIVKDNLVVSGLASMDQVYRYGEGDHDDECYFRKVGSENYTIVYDEIREGSCDERLGYEDQLRLPLRSGCRLAS